MKRTKFEIRLLQAAEEDFKALIAYIAIDNPNAAAAVASKIEKSLFRLSSYPFLGKIPNEEELAQVGYRFLIVQNYLIFYTVEDRIVWVHRIIHGARNYLSLL
jgi:toxin ParE1/3/4